LHGRVVAPLRGLKLVRSEGRPKEKPEEKPVEKKDADKGDAGRR